MRLLIVMITSTLLPLKDRLSRMLHRQDPRH